MITLTENEVAADRIIQSDLVRPATARAILAAFRHAAGGPVRMEHVRSAARECSAKLRNVAAGFGLIRCTRCGDHVYITTKPKGRVGECGHSLDILDDEHQATLTVHLLLCGGTLEQSFSINEKWAGRIRRYGSQADRKMFLPPDAKAS